MRLRLLVTLLAASFSTASPPAPQAKLFRPEQRGTPSARPLLGRTLLAAKPAPEEEPTSGVASTALQIINNVAGAGILTLSAGMAGGVGIVPAAALCLVLGIVSGVSFYIVGAACEITGETTFRGLWSRTLGASSAWIVDLSIALMCLAATIIYSGILGDVSTSLLALGGLPRGSNSRDANILAITLSALLPLSLIQVDPTPAQCPASALRARTRRGGRADSAACAPTPRRARPRSGPLGACFHLGAGLHGGAVHGRLRRRACPRRLLPPRF